MKKVIAEFLGTFILVFLGTAAVVSAKTISTGITGVSVSPAFVLEIGLTFGLTLVAIAYAFGPISGAHVNPAVTLGMLIARKIDMRGAVGYWLAQFAGGVLASVALMMLIGDGEKHSLGANGAGKFGFKGAMIFEVVSTLLFFLVIYGAAASKRANAAFAGLPIGFYLLASHLAGIPISGSSLNPARDFGPALLTGGQVLSDFWLLYLVGPMVGGAIGGFLATVVHEGD